MIFSTQANTISAENIRQLSRCRGWALTFAIFLFLYAVLLFVALMSSIGESNDAPLALFIHACTGTFFVLAGVNLCKFSSQIREAANTLNPHSLEAAMKSQARAWLWLGICAIIYLIITVIVLSVTLLSS